MVDDKQRVLTAMKKIWARKLVTVFPRQGHYANDPANLARYPSADLSVERIGELLQPDIERSLAAAIQEKP
jgi:hypothetical protein